MNLFSEAQSVLLLGIACISLFGIADVMKNYFLIHNSNTLRSYTIVYNASIKTLVFLLIYICLFYLSGFIINTTCASSCIFIAGHRFKSMNEALNNKSIRHLSDSDQHAWLAVMFSDLKLKLLFCCVYLYSSIVLLEFNDKFVLITIAIIMFDLFRSYKAVVLSREHSR